VNSTDNRLRNRSGLDLVLTAEDALAQRRQPRALILDHRCFPYPLALSPLSARDGLALTD
jgi:hypothetical protein